MTASDADTSPPYVVPPPPPSVPHPPPPREPGDVMVEWPSTDIFDRYAVPNAQEPEAPPNGSEG